MVVFTCNNCGESLRKPMVEKHYAFSCRRAKSLTCVDCLKDFNEEEYVAHTKCLTEEERYAAKGSMPNGVVKKGELKQESWIDMIRSILDKEPNLKQSQRTLLETVSNYDNIPRKKPKFLNFIKSSSGNRVNMRDVEDIWNIIEKYKNNKSLQNGTNGTIEKNENSTTLEDKSNKTKVDEDKTNEVVEEQPKQKKKKKHSNGTIEKNENSTTLEDKSNKRKVDEDKTNEVVEEQPKQKKKKKHSNGTVENNENSQIKDTSTKKNVEENTSEVVEQLKRNKKEKRQSNVESEKKVEEAEPIIEKQDVESPETEKFSFQNKILSILQSKGTVSLRKLEKKILNAYLKHSGESEISPKISKKFNKKLKKMTELEINDDTVSLKQ